MILFFVDFNHRPMLVIGCIDRIGAVAMGTVYNGEWEASNGEQKK